MCLPTYWSNGYSFRLPTTNETSFALIKLQINLKINFSFSEAKWALVQEWSLGYPETRSNTNATVEVLFLPKCFISPESRKFCHTARHSNLWMICRILPGRRKNCHSQIKVTIDSVPEGQGFLSTCTSLAPVVRTNMVITVSTETRPPPIKTRPFVS
jgi:hypothetical protein